jgi:hypothetical protein
MSFGKLNILQHKSWNVWNRDNIEKVLKDERELAEKEEKKRAQLMSVESERRTEMLRARRRKEDVNDAGKPVLDMGGKGSELVSTGNSEHVEASGKAAYKGYDLFEDGAALTSSAQNASATSSGQNREHEEEKRKEKEKEERKWGLVALGQDSFTGESDAQKPW